MKSIEQATSATVGQYVVPFGDLRLDYHAHQVGVDAALKAVLESGRFILGDVGRHFEDSFAAYCDTAYGVGVGSGTDALCLALQACHLKPGDEVMTVANAGIPTIAAIHAAGGIPVFVDCEPAAFTLDVTRLAERLSGRSRVIIPVHLYGQAADMQPILDFATQHHLQVIEDCSQAHGATYRGRKVGSWGDLGCYSFYPSKNLGAYGDGGMVLTNNPKMAEELKALRQYGQQDRYVSVIKGYNSRLDEMQAAILQVKLASLDEENARRQQIAARYTRHLGGIVGCPQVLPDRQHVFHLYVVQVEHRDEFQRHMKAEGVETLIHYPIPVHQQEAYAECLDQAAFLPVTEAMVKSIVSLPMHPYLTDAQVTRVIEAASCWQR